MSKVTYGDVRTVGGTVHHTKLLRCSFCDKHQNEVEWLIAAPPLNKWAASHICEECVEAAVNTLKEARRIERARRR